MKLSPNFSLDEFIYSETAIGRGWDNTPNDDQVEAMTALCVAVLQPIRSWYGKPMSIRSGFRSMMLNKAVVGAANSQHMKGEAADVSVNYTEKLFPLIEFAITAQLPFDQIILYPGSFFIHFSHKREGTNRRQVLVKENGGYQEYTLERLEAVYGAV